MTPRQKQIFGAMSGRQASAVADNTLHEAVRSKLIEIGSNTGHPLHVNAVPGIVAAVLRSASRTLIFEGEVPIALEMGAAGELEHEATTINQTNASKWVTAYACCGDRRAAQNMISIQSARDRARIGAVAAEELRERFRQDGLRRGWEYFIANGWNFRPGYGASLYDRIDKTAVRSLLNGETIAEAKGAAIDALRRDDPHRYRTMPQPDLEATPTFTMYWKAQLCRAYFERLREQRLDITFKPVAA